jgi:hypothetical protein
MRSNTSRPVRGARVVISTDQIGDRQNRAANAWLPLAAVSRGAVQPPNETHAHFCGGSADLTRQPNPVQMPSHRFDVNVAKMPQPQSAVAPAKLPRAVPVEPPRPAGLPLAYLRNAKDWK